MWNDYGALWGFFFGEVALVLALMLIAAVGVWAFLAGLFLAGCVIFGGLFFRFRVSIESVQEGKG